MCNHRHGQLPGFDELYGVETDGEYQVCGARNDQTFLLQAMSIVPAK